MKAFGIIIIIAFSAKHTPAAAELPIPAPARERSTQRPGRRAFSPTCKMIKAKPNPTHALRTTYCCTRSCRACRCANAALCCAVLLVSRLTGLFNLGAPCFAVDTLFPVSPLWLLFSVAVCVYRSPKLAGLDCGVVLLRVCFCGAMRALFFATGLCCLLRSLPALSFVPTVRMTARNPARYLFCSRV